MLNLFVHRIGEFLLFGCRVDRNRFISGGQNSHSIITFDIRNFPPRSRLLTLYKFNLSADFLFTDSRNGKCSNYSRYY